MLGLFNYSAPSWLDSAPLGSAVVTHPKPQTKDFLLVSALEQDVRTSHLLGNLVSTLGAAWLWSWSNAPKEITPYFLTDTLRPTNSKNFFYQVAGAGMSMQSSLVSSWARRCGSKGLTKATFVDHELACMMCAFVSRMAGGTFHRRVLHCGTKIRGRSDYLNTPPQRDDLGQRAKMPRASPEMGSFGP